ncbi:MAG: hypothetical protein JXR83_05870 [Deltaproteobacteria bacterium]|nr:hypothetical protein [Deltaproteobacteria bacterium]
MIAILVVDAQGELGDVDAVVVEDDTYHVLSADPAWRPVAEHPLRVLNAAIGALPDALGDVTVVEERPLKLCAVIHDLDREPSCDQRAIGLALAEVLAIVQRRELRSLALPLLGTVHGRVPVADAIEILRGALAGASATTLRGLELRVAAADVDRVRALLEPTAPQP